MKHKGKSALRWLASNNKLVRAKFMLEHGADVNIFDNVSPFLNYFDIFDTSL